MSVLSTLPNKQKILLLNGNPKKASLSRRFIEVYFEAIKNHAQVEVVHLEALSFNTDLSTGYDSPIEMEPCLVEFQEKLLQADQLVIALPVWWGGLPAKLKGLIDRTFSPGFAFRYESNNPEVIPLLKGKRAKIFITMDMPEPWKREQAQPIIDQLDKYTLQFCGFEPADIHLFGSVIMSDTAELNRWIQTIESLASASIEMTKTVQTG